MKTLTASEFAQMIANLFPALSKYDRHIMVFDETGNCAIFAKETAKGYSSVTVRPFGPYTKLTAAKKQECVEYVKNLHIEIATYTMRNGFVHKCYHVAGTTAKEIESHRGQHWYEWEKAHTTIENYR